MNTETQTLITVKTAFEGIHSWPEAPEQVAFLRSPHRHIFYVEMTLPVEHNDRQLEFFMVKKFLDEYIGSQRFNSTHTLSCEEMAAMIRQRFDAAWVEVNEDGQNGATVLKVRDVPSRSIDLRVPTQEEWDAMLAVATKWEKGLFRSWANVVGHAAEPIRTGRFSKMAQEFIDRRRARKGGSLLHSGREALKEFADLCDKADAEDRASMEAANEPYKRENKGCS